jgi:hypothetical protein
MEVIVVGVYHRFAVQLIQLEANSREVAFSECGRLSELGRVGPRLAHELPRMRLPVLQFLFLTLFESDNPLWPKGEDQDVKKKWNHQPVHSTASSEHPSITNQGEQTQS